MYSPRCSFVLFLLFFIYLNDTFLNLFFSFIKTAFLLQLFLMKLIIETQIGISINSYVRFKYH